MFIQKVIFAFIQNNVRLIVTSFVVVSLVAGGTLVIQKNIQNSLEATQIDLSPVKATISWNTPIEAKGTVEYGMTTDYGLTHVESNPQTTQQADLTDLAPSATYHFRIKAYLESEDDPDMVTSEDDTFTTPYCSTGNDNTNNPDPGNLNINSNDNANGNSNSNSNGNSNDNTNGNGNTNGELDCDNSNDNENYNTNGDSNTNTNGDTNDNTNGNTNGNINGNNNTNTNGNANDNTNGNNPDGCGYLDCSSYYNYTCGTISQPNEGSCYAYHVYPVQYGSGGWGEFLGGELSVSASECLALISAQLPTNSCWSFTEENVGGTCSSETARQELFVIESGYCEYSTEGSLMPANSAIMTYSADNNNFASLSFEYGTQKDNYPHAIPAIKIKDNEYTASIPNAKSRTYHYRIATTDKENKIAYSEDKTLKYGHWLPRTFNNTTGTIWDSIKNAYHKVVSWF